MFESSTLYFSSNLSSYFIDLSVKIRHNQTEMQRQFTETHSDGAAQSCTQWIGIGNHSAMMIQKTELKMATKIYSDFFKNNDNKFQITSDNNAIIFNQITQIAGNGAALMLAKSSRRSISSSSSPTIALQMLEKSFMCQIV